MRSSPFPKSAAEALAALAELARMGSGLDVADGEDGAGGALVRAGRDPSDQRLLLAEARYRGLIEQIPAVTFLARLTGGRNEMYVSPQIQELLGFTQEEWLGDPTIWYRQTHPDDRDRVSTAFAASCLTGKPFREVFRVVTRSGETVWVNASARLVRDSRGDLLFLQGVGFDVTEQFRAAEAREQLLREQSARVQADRDRSRLREIFANLPAAMWLLEAPEWRVEIMNPVAQRLFRVGPERLGERFVEVFPALAELAARFDELADGATLRLDEHAVIAEGWDRARYFDLVCQPLQDPRGTRLLLHATEATERVDARLRIESALRLREDFIAIAAHELRTPVTSVMGQAQLALRRVDREHSVDAPRIRQSLEVILRQAAKLGGLISQLLDVSRLETGKLELLRERVDLVPLVDRIVTSARMLAEQHRITTSLPASLEAELDELRLEQVLTNLVQNAIKYSPGGGDIEVGLRPVDSLRAQLWVRDHGIGIPPDKRGRIFERFFQADATRAPTGLGLGLYITREIVNLHGGEIWAEFPDDGGTRFVVEVPTGARA